MKKVLINFLCIILTFSMVACSKPSKDIKEVSVTEKKYEEILKEAKGTTVNFYGYGGNEVMNKWFDTYVIPQMSEKYEVTVKRIGMNIDEILNKLLSDKQAGNKEGAIDVFWLNGENFSTAKKSGLLLGKFTEKLPNYMNLIDTNSDSVTYDFGTEVENMEAPWGKAQFAVAVNSEKISKDIGSAQKLKEVIKENPGKFTYPAPPDFTGSAFVRNIIYDVVGYEKVSNLPKDESKIKEIIKPAIDYLNEIKPYLWNKGKNYPATTAQLDNMYSDEETYFTMTYAPDSYESKIKSGTFSKGTKFIKFKDGNISNTHFLSMPFNTTKQYGAMVLINFLMSIDAQGSKTFSENWGDSTVININKISDNEKTKFNDKSVVLENSRPELEADIVPIIEKIWNDEVLEIDK